MDEPIFYDAPMIQLCFCEPWIEHKLKERLLQYKKRYPRFDIERVLRDVELWEPKAQRWSPYMTDKDIKKLNRAYHRSKSFSSLCENNHL